MIRPDQAVHQRAEVLVGLDPGAGGHRHLHQAHLLPKLGVSLEHPLVGEEPAGYALGVVEPIDAHQDPHAPIAAERLRLGLDGGVAREILEQARVHAHREDAEPHFTAGELHPVDVHGEAQDVGESGGEVAEVGGGVKADQVGAEQAFEELSAGRKGSEQLLGGKRDVEKEPDPRIRQPATEQPRQQQELVVVDPDQVAGPVLRRHHLGELLVGLHVGVPIAGLERDLVEQVVKQRPEHPVGVALVVAGDEVRAERHPDEALGGELSLELRSLRGAEIVPRPGPADPEPARLLVGSGEAGGEPARAPLHLDATGAWGGR